MELNPAKALLHKLFPDKSAVREFVRWRRLMHVERARREKIDKLVEQRRNEMIHMTSDAHDDEFDMSAETVWQKVENI